MTCWQEGVEEQLAGMDRDMDESYIIALERSGSHASVVLRVDCSPEDILEAYVHAYVVLHANRSLVGPSVNALPEQYLDAVWSRQ